MPLFITASNDNKLDPSDAVFVDVIHTNALVQGKIERCGHVDFYMNGGILQPGCVRSGLSKSAPYIPTKRPCLNVHIFSTDPIACSHHRAPDYFRESIQSNRGFYGWPCTSYINYLLGFCPRTSKIEVLAGEDCQTSTIGMFMITTNSENPFAIGQWTEAAISTRIGGTHRPPASAADPFQQQIDQWGKLESTFNNVDNTHKRFGFTALDSSIGGGGDTSYDSNYLDSTVVGLRSPIDNRRINNKFSPTDNYFMQYRYNLTKNIISDDEFQTPNVQV